MNPKIQSYKELLESLKEYNATHLIEWLRFYLAGQIDSINLPPEKEFAIENIYYNSNDLKFQNRMEIAIGLLIETYQPERDSAAFLYYLLSIVISLQPLHAKVAVREMLYNNIVIPNGLQFEDEDLFSVLLFANCSYSIDDTLRDFLLYKLPEKEEFKKYALQGYKCLIDTMDESAYLFIPSIAQFWNDDNFFEDFSIQFKLSVEELGAIRLAPIYQNIIESLKKYGNNTKNKFISLIIDEDLIDKKYFNNADYSSMIMQIYQDLEQEIPFNYFQKMMSVVLTTNKNKFESNLRKYINYIVFERQRYFDILEPLRAVTKIKNPMIIYNNKYYGYIHSNSIGLKMFDEKVQNQVIQMDLKRDSSKIMKNINEMCRDLTQKVDSIQSN